MKEKLKKITKQRKQHEVDKIFGTVDNNHTGYRM
jgi:hypothetical protein